MASSVWCHLIPIHYKRYCHPILQLRRSRLVASHYSIVFSVTSQQPQMPWSQSTCHSLGTVTLPFQITRHLIGSCYPLNSHSVLIIASLLPFISRYKSSLYPDNMETLTILNDSPMVVEAYFCFQHDVKASTYFLEPVNMTLKPNEKQVQSKGGKSIRVKKVVKTWHPPCKWLPLTLSPDPKCMGLPYCSRCLWRQHCLLHQGEPRASHL